MLGLSLTVVIALLHLSCSDDSGPGDQANNRISITNNTGVLASRVTYLDDSVPLDSVGPGYQRFDGLRLVAEVAPPSIDSQVLQATSVSIVGNLAVVSYNMSGASYLGAVDVIDISSRNRPVLVSQALFQNTDVNAVTVSGQYVYVAEATNDTGFAFPAVFELMQLHGNQLVLDGNARRGLSSFAATSVAASGTLAYATSGDAGGLFVINPATLAVSDSIALHDARWVTVAGGKVVVIQGTPGTLTVYNESNMSAVGSWPFAGASVPEAKSQGEVVGGKAFIAAGDSGVQVHSVSTGLKVGAVPRPNPSPADVVANAVAIDEDLMFISNGGAGVYLAQGSRDFAATGSEEQQTITMLGHLRFDNIESVNHVAVAGRLLIIAAGLGGLKIVLY